MNMSPEDIKRIIKDTLMEHLGIEYLEIGKGAVTARMPVDHRTLQPAGRLHGGAMMALAESVGSAGSFALIDPNRYEVLGVEISGSHVGNTSCNFVMAEGRLLHKGKTSHVWEILIKDENERLLSVCRLTNRIIPVKPAAAEI